MGFLFSKPQAQQSVSPQAVKPTLSKAQIDDFSDKSAKAILKAKERGYTLVLDAAVWWTAQGVYFSAIVFKSAKEPLGVVQIEPSRDVVFFTRSMSSSYDVDNLKDVFGGIEVAKSKCKLGVSTVCAPELLDNMLRSNGFKLLRDVDEGEWKQFVSVFAK